MKGWTSWNLWHGCRKLSEGCANCYVYRGDARRGRDSSVIAKNECFDLPVRRMKRSGKYKVPPGALMGTCFTSDFFLEEADQWRAEAWAMMRERQDIHFFFITKRIDRFHVALPEDWGDGYDNVTIACTVENQSRADYRLPLLKAAPIKRRMIICEPLLEKIDLSSYLDNSFIQVVAGGESGAGARVCEFDWIISLREQCRNAGVSFWFKQTGTKFVKDGLSYRIDRRLQHSQARKAGINIAVKMY